MQAPVPNSDLHRLDATAIIWKRDEDGTLRYLITKRAPHKPVMPNRWTVPGGGIEPADYMRNEPQYLNDESPQWYGAVERALRREIREEVGLEVGDLHYLLDVAFMRPDGTPEIVLSYYGEYQGGEVALDKDATEYAWISAAELKDYDLISGIDYEIREVEERLN